MCVDSLQELIQPDFGKYQHQMKLICENVQHPFMVYLKQQAEVLLKAIETKGNIKMPALLDHLKFLKEGYELNNKSSYKDVVFVYSFAECCGYTVIVKKSEEELRIRYNPKAPMP